MARMSRLVTKTPPMVMARMRPKLQTRVMIHEMLPKVIEILRCDDRACFVVRLIVKGHCNLNNMFDLRRLRRIEDLRGLRMLKF
jgi:hypothetical protein